MLPTGLTGSSLALSAVDLPAASSDIPSLAAVLMAVASAVVSATVRLSSAAPLRHASCYRPWITAAGCTSVVATVARGDEKPVVAAFAALVDDAAPLGDEAAPPMPFEGDEAVPLAAEALLSGAGMVPVALLDDMPPLAAPIDPLAADAASLPIAPMLPVAAAPPPVVGPPEPVDVDAPGAPPAPSPDRLAAPGAVSLMR
jgi:hypothetical protein